MEESSLLKYQLEFAVNYRGTSACILKMYDTKDVYKCKFSK